jgi:glycosyltransferase involved in cell wall biosynthesis
VKITFFAPVRNDWIHAERLLASIRRTFRWMPWEIIFVDDASKPEQILIAKKLKQEFRFRVTFNAQHRGIVACLNQLAQELPPGIAIPVSADMELCNSVFPWVLQYAFVLKKADFVFAKCRHNHIVTQKSAGVTGWATQKGIQKVSNSKEEFVTGKTRPSGYAVALRSCFVKQYGYDQALGPLCDFYLNNLMILKHKAFYYGKVVSNTLQRKASYSGSFHQADSLALVEKTVTKFESDGVILTDAQKSRYREYERSQWPH